MTSVTGVPCPVCHQPLILRPARGRKSGKTFLMLVCHRDGRHFRGFINDRQYVDSVLARLEGQTTLLNSGPDPDVKPSTSITSNAILDQRNS